MMQFKSGFIRSSLTIVNDDSAIGVGLALREAFGLWSLVTLEGEVWDTVYLWWRFFLAPLRGIGGEDQRLEIGVVLTDWRLEKGHGQVGRGGGGC
jgi:hypothetical protein